MVIGEGALCPNGQEGLLGTSQPQLNTDGGKCMGLAKHEGLVSHVWGPFPSWLLEPWGDLGEKTSPFKISSSTQAVMVLLVHPVWYCREQWQERGIESLGEALESHLLHRLAAGQVLTHPCTITLWGRKHPERTTGSRRGSSGHGGVRSPGRGGNQDISPAP